MPVSKRRKSRQTRRIEKTHDEVFSESRGYSSLTALERRISKTPQLLAARLTSRMAQKREAHRHSGNLLSPEAWLGLTMLPIADIALSACNADWPEIKAMPGSPRWGEHLRWGLDEFAEIHRLAAAGMTYGALLTTRLFLERWTINVASNQKIVSAEGEQDSTYITRVWSIYGDHVDLDMGEEWSWLSECLHGRANYPSVLSSLFFVDGSDVVAPPAKAFLARICSIARVVLDQVLMGIHWEMNQQGIKRVPSPARVRMEGPPQELLENISRSDVFHNQFNALDPVFTFSSRADNLISVGRRYRLSTRSAGNETKKKGANVQRDFLSALLERRGRSVELARKAFQQETSFNDPATGHPFLLARLFRYGAIAEGAILVAGLSSKPDAHALRTAATALESAWRLWLDDADTALGCCRGILEQTARARVHRVKPEKAKKLESARNAPHRWLEAARLKRLDEVGRALGEFAHLKVTSRRQIARRRLVDVQEVDVQHPEHSARLHALDTSAYFLAREVYSRLDVHYPKLAEGFRRTVTLMDQDGHERFEEDVMNRGISIRDKDWGEADFTFSF